MIDPKLLRQSAAEVAKNLARRGFVFDADAYLALEERRKQVALAAARGGPARRRQRVRLRAHHVHELEAAPAPTWHPRGCEQQLSARIC